MKKMFLLGICAAAMFSCKHEMIEPIEECPTYPLGWDNVIGGNTYVYPDFEFKAPVFNPNNPSEFAYVRKPTGNIFNFELRKHNILNGSDEFISTINYANYKITWSQTDWIIFNQTLYEIWKIKSDGTGLVQLTITGQEMNPIWKPDGSAYIYTALTGGPYKIIASQDGMLLDTVPINADVPSWSLNNAILHTKNYQGQNTMAIYDVPSEEVTIVPDVPSYELYEWLPNSQEFVGSHNGSLWHVNASTGHKILIKEPCGDKYRYFSFAVSPDGSRILSERITSTQIDSTTYSISNDIVIMNIDGSNEQVVELPQ